MPDRKRAKDKGELLSPYGPRKYPPIVERIPGFDDGPRPLLSFVVRVANGKHKAMVRHHLKTFLIYDFQFQTPDTAIAAAALYTHPRMLGYAADRMIATMRELADMWIDSGKSRTDEGVDTPTDRNVEDFLPGKDYSLFHRIRVLLLNEYPRHTGMRRDGTLEIIDSFPKFNPDKLNFGLQAAYEAFGDKWAAFHFSRLLDSPHSRHLSRCDNCKSYFGYQRARLRTVKHGVFCPACEGSSSVKRTVFSRSKRFDTAARAWIAWESKRKGRVRTEWVADQVNKAHGTAFGRRWVTQNLAEIQTRMEALRNAKG